MARLLSYGVALERHVDGCSCVDDALVEDSHLAGIVVHRVVGAFGEGSRGRGQAMDQPAGRRSEDVPRGRPGGRRGQRQHPEPLAQPVGILFHHLVSTS